MMYRHYTLEEHLRITDQCAAKLRELLLTRYGELEKLRDEINDRYPFEDLYLRQDEVDDEERMIKRLLEQLEANTAEIKEEKRRLSKETFGGTKKPAEAADQHLPPPRKAMNIPSFCPSAFSSTWKHRKR